MLNKFELRQDRYPTTKDVGAVNVFKLELSSFKNVDNSSNHQHSGGRFLIPANTKLNLNEPFKYPSKEAKNVALKSEPPKIGEPISYGSRSIEEPSRDFNNTGGFKKLEHKVYMLTAKTQYVPTIDK